MKFSRVGLLKEKITENIRKISIIIIILIIKKGKFKF